MKKLTALMLALLMLALPVLGMAASPMEMLEGAMEAGRPWTNTFTFVPGKLPVDDQTAALVNDVLNAISLRTSFQQGETNQFDFVLGMSGNDVLNVSVANTDDMTYVNSSLLGADTIACNAEEGEKLIDRFMQMMVASGQMTEEDAALVKAQLAQSMETMGSAFSMALVPNADFFAEFDEAELIALGQKVLGNIKIEEVTAQPKNADPAAAVVTSTATGEDILTAFDLAVPLLKKNAAYMQYFDQLGQMMEPAMTGEEAFDEGVKTVREAMEKIDLKLDLSLYMNEAQEIVYGLLNVTAVTEAKETINMEGSYARLTAAEGVTHTATLIAQDGESDGFSVTFDMMQSEPKTVADFSAAEIKAGVTGEPAFYVTYANDKAYGEETAKDAMKISITVNDEETNEPVTFDLTMDIAAEKQGEDVTMTADIKMYGLGQEEPLMGYKVETVTGVAAPSIVTADAVHPGAMDDAEFNAFLNGVVQALQTNVLVIVQNLPVSVLQQMMAE